MISAKLWPFCSNLRVLTHCGLMTPYGNIELGQHWLKERLVAWQHQAITWANVDLSYVMSHDIHLRAILQEIPPTSTKINLKITHLKFHSNLPGAIVLASHPCTRVLHGQLC